MTAACALPSIPETIDEIPGYPHGRAVRLPTPVLIITTRGVKGLSVAKLGPRFTDRISVCL